ncbi:hypothetical protein BANRA_01657 [Klebsiella pneumoniae]|nr:Uncharacterised protein [Klebsiella pneumoniae]VCX57542.1 hypothetical protein BANRA_04709 [Klebsiella pneumoniae]VCZ66933.1 hypothetical protein BANRA_01657 [Klebsiella pneumoniae]VDA19833.1 hypothetical protein BANRA_02180 [Klebsiella pneumoniae]
MIANEIQGFHFIRSNWQVNIMINNLKLFYIVKKILKIVRFYFRD